LLLPYRCCHWVNHCSWEPLLASQQQPQQSFFSRHR